MASVTQEWEMGPRERLRQSGVAQLDDSDLVAIVLGTGYRGVNAEGVARQLLRSIGGIGGLVRQGLGSLSDHPGMGVAKASRLLSATEIGVRIQTRPHPVGRGFQCSGDIFARYGGRLRHQPQELFLVVGLNNKNAVLTETVVAMGSVDECKVSPREVFRPLIAEACARMIALHNHPSGDPSPSPEDVALTRRIARAGDLVGIPMLDHLVVGGTSYSSFRDLGLLSR